MTNNFPKALLITSALYLFIGGLVAILMVNFVTSSKPNNCTQLCLAYFEEAKLQPTQLEPKPKTKTTEKITKKESDAQPAQEAPKEEQKPVTQHAQSSIAQSQKIQESVTHQKQYNDLNGKKIREILIKHADNSYAQKARNKNVNGTCKISFVLHPDGTVSDKDVSDCHKLLKSSAEMAIEDAAHEFPKPHDNCRVTTSIDYEIIN